MKKLLIIIFSLIFSCGTITITGGPSGDSRERGFLYELTWFEEGHDDEGGYARWDRTSFEEHELLNYVLDSLPNCCSMDDEGLEDCHPPQGMMPQYIEVIEPSSFNLDHGIDDSTYYIDLFALGIYTLDDYPLCYYVFGIDLEENVFFFSSEDGVTPITMSNTKIEAWIGDTN